MRKKGPDAKYPLVKQDPPVTYFWGAEIDRESARSLGLKRYFTGKPCMWGHVDERWVASGTCIQCVLQRHRTEEYREVFNPQERVSWLRNREAYNAQRRAVKAAKPVKSEQRRASCRAAWVERRAKAV